MFNFGIVATSIAIVCPGGQREQFIEMRDGTQGIVLAAGIILWLPLRQSK